MRARRRVEGERGETLLELVISIAILGIAVVAIASGIALSIKVSDIHRKQATADVYLHRDAEQLAGSYVAACPPSYSIPTDPGFRPPVIGIEFWNGTNFTGSCPGPGLQRLTIRLTSTDNRVIESLVVIVRKPCGPGSSC